MTPVFIPKDWDLVHQIGQDWSPRRFYRVAGFGITAILMDSSGPQIPGHNISDFLRIGAWLKESGLRVPFIIDADEKAGWVLMEDFGTQSFKSALDQNYEGRWMYTLAADVLKKIQNAPCTIKLPVYEESHVHKGRQRIIDWYVPAITGRKNPPGLRDEYLEVWQKIEAGLAPCKRGFLHIDFHVENLMILDEEGTDMCGILDFQGGMIGPVPYDLANLLEDARRDVAPELREFILAWYCQGMAPEEEQNFRAWYRILATQFHCRVIGQAIKLAATNNNAKLLEYIPRLQKYILAGVEAPVLEPLKIFFAKNGIGFTRPVIADMGNLKSIVADDAF